MMGLIQLHARSADDVAIQLFVVHPHFRQSFFFGHNILFQYHFIVQFVFFFFFSLPFLLSLFCSSLHALCRVICTLLNQTRIVSARSGIRKYVVWCLICGGLSCLLGIMFLGVYFLVRSYTSTIGYFETVPTFVPATLVSNFAKNSHSISNYF